MNQYLMVIQFKRIAVESASAVCAMFSLTSQDDFVHVAGRHYVSSSLEKLIS